MILSRVRHYSTYTAIEELNREEGMPVAALCEIAGIARSAYYKWTNRVCPESEKLDLELLEYVRQIHSGDDSMGYRRINDELKKHGKYICDSHALRICRAAGIRSKIKYANNGCTVSDKSPEHTSENVLNREFTAEAPNLKWLTDVTEFKYYEGPVVHKVYLSAILDLFDRRIVSYVIGDSNNNPLVFETFDRAVAENPDAHPIFHSDRGFQYTSPAFQQRLENAGMTRSMSRVGKCIDNGPMEGFWGMLKRERYYRKRFESRDSLVQMIEKYIDYYNNGRSQRKLGILTPMEKHNLYYAAA